LIESVCILFTLLDSECVCVLDGWFFLANDMLILLINYGLRDCSLLLTEWFLDGILCFVLFGLWWFGQVYWRNHMLIYLAILVYIGEYFWDLNMLPLFCWWPIMDEFQWVKIVNNLLVMVLLKNFIVKDYYDFSV
jgi:hypothetical protein